MSNIVSRQWHAAPGSRAFSLYCGRGRRKYLTQAERQRALAAAAASECPEPGLFAITLAWTGARVSEVLAIAAEDCDVERSVIALRTLKRRGPVVREVPVPPAAMRLLEAHFDLYRRQRDAALRGERLWPVTRVTAWRWIKAVMDTAGISGAPASPRGFRHGYGVHALHAGIPLNLIQRWLGHARISTTAIYADAAGPDECMLAERLWCPETTAMVASSA